MAILNDIQQLQKEGNSDEQIISILQSKGISPREISEAIAQSKVKEAVVGNIPETMAPTPAAPQPEAYAPSPEYAPSEAQPQADVIPAAAQPEAYPPQYPQGAEAYPQYQQQPQLSTDIISEVADQIISEKLSPIKTQLEKILDLKSTIESKMEYLDERLKRIEKIIDRLQLSVLQKVGDYLTNVEDIKKEIVETQKSFKSASQSAEKSEKPEKPAKLKPSE